MQYCKIKKHDCNGMMIYVRTSKYVTRISMHTLYENSWWATTKCSNGERSRPRVCAYVCLQKRSWKFAYIRMLRFIRDTFKIIVYLRSRSILVQELSVRKSEHLRRSEDKEWWGGDGCGYVLSRALIVIALLSE